MSGVARWRYAIGVGEGGRRGCPLTVLPKKKGDWIVVISGDHQGIVAEVIVCKTKVLKAEVVANRAKIAFNFSDICRLTRPE